MFTAVPPLQPQTGKTDLGLNNRPFTSLFLFFSFLYVKSYTLGIAAFMHLTYESYESYQMFKNWVPVELI